MHSQIRFHEKIRKICQNYSQIIHVSFPLLNLYVLIPGQIPYFFSYKLEIFSFQNNPKNLDPSFKVDLDLRDCLGRVKLVL